MKPIVDKRTSFAGRILNFVNPMQTVAHSLPNPSPVIVIDIISPNGKTKNLLVEQRLVHIALMILKDRNPFYAEIEIDREVLRQPASREDVELLGEVEHLYDSGSFPRKHFFLFKTYSALRLERSVIDDTKRKLREYLVNYSGDRIPVQAAANQGIDPITTVGYIQKAFPHLFPCGEILMGNAHRSIPISEIDLIKHLVNLKDQRFCKDSIFPYVLMDLKNRLQTRKMTRFFISVNPIEGGYSTEQLLELSETEILKKLYPCLHPILGSVAYYKDKRKKLM